MKKSLFVFFFIITICLLTGCWDSQELNEVSIVTGLAIEKGEDKKFRLSVEVINASEFAHNGGTGDAPSIVFSMEGDSVSELADKMNKGFIRKLIYSHTRVLVIDEELARTGLVGFLDFFERSGEIRNDFNILITRGVKASDIIKITYPTQKSPSMKVSSQSETFMREWGGDPHIRLTDFVEALVSNGRHPVAASISVEGEPHKGKTVDNNKNLDLDAIVVFDGLALFKNDKLQGFLTLEDSRNYMWMKDLENTTLTIPCSEKEDNYSDIRIIHSKPEKTVRYKGDIPEITITIKAEANLQGTQCGEELSKIDTYKNLEKELSKNIESTIFNTVTKVQEEYGIDIFGFGEDLRRQDYQKYKQVEKEWDKEFSKAEINVAADTFIRRSGIRSDSFLTELKKKMEEEE